MSSTSLFQNSPFGSNWENPSVLYDQDDRDENEHAWLFRVKKSTDGAALMAEYKKDDVDPGQNGGRPDDNKTDIIVYYELPTAGDDTPICFVKMNRNFASRLRGDTYGNEWSDRLVQKVVDYSKDHPPLINANRLRAAVDFAVEERINGLGLLQQFGSWLLQKLANLIRGLKLKENNWNPNSKNYDPIIPTVLADKAVKGWIKLKKGLNSFLKEISDAADWCEKNLPFIGGLIGGFIHAVGNVLKLVTDAIDNVFTILKEASHLLKLVNAFLCGAINEIIETVAALTDLAALLIRLTDPIEQELLKETLENIKNELSRNPGIIWEKIKEGIHNLIERYSFDKGEYQIAYNLGEDTIAVLFLAEAIISAVRLLKNLPKAFRNLTGWIERNGKRIIRRGGRVITEEHIALSKRISEFVKDRIAKQLFNNLDKLYDAARIADTELEGITRKFARETNGKPGFREGLKERPRALEKIEGEYGGDASLLLDISGSKVVYDNLDEIYKALEKFSKEFEILRFKDRIQNPLPNGYRDILMNIKMSNGHIVEFRLHLKAMNDVADKAGHAYYKQIRTLETISKKRQLTVKEKTKLLELDQKEKALYEAAWNNFQNK